MDKKILDIIGYLIVILLALWVVGMVVRFFFGGYGMGWGGMMGWGGNYCGTSVKGGTTYYPGMMRWLGDGGTKAPVNANTQQ